MSEQLIYILEQLNNIGYDNLLLLFAPLVYCYFSTKVNAAYTLHKDFKPKNIKRVEIPPELKQKYSSVEIEQITSKKIKEATSEFIDVMVENFPPETLINFYNNINEVKIKKTLLPLLINAFGTYNPILNEIMLVTTRSIYHELFHMASTINKGKLPAFSSELYIGGFHQSNPNFYFYESIGNGLNEGYTELLTQRYFGEKYKIHSPYKAVVKIVGNLEEIVGKDKMETLYLTADLAGLINELKKYSTEEEITKFITGTDLICNHYNDMFLFKNKKIQISFDNVYEFLYKTYLVKLKQQLEKKEISVDDFVRKYTKYINSLGTSAKVDGYKYKFLSADKILQIMENLESEKEMQDEDSGFKM